MANYSGLEYMSTGGNNPPSVQTMYTGGNQLPEVLPPPYVPYKGMPTNEHYSMGTGGNLPPQAVSSPYTYSNPGPEFSAANVVNGINNRLAQDPLPTGTQVVQGINGTFTNAALPTATNTTMGALDQLLSGDNSYIANARRRGLETAASRGLLNSSIASGASERAAIESSMPILGQIMGLQGQREGQDFNAQQTSRAQALGLTAADRNQAYTRSNDAFNRAAALQDSREGRALQSTMQERQLSQARDMQYNDAALQDWMNSNQFNRQFNANLAMMPINNTYQFMQTIAQYGLENPEVYTPDVISGTSNFFTRNMFDILRQYFPGTFSSGGTP